MVQCGASVHHAKRWLPPFWRKLLPTHLHVLFDTTRYDGWLQTFLGKLLLPSSGYGMEAASSERMTKCTRIHWVITHKIPIRLNRVSCCLILYTIPYPTGPDSVVGIATGYGLDGQGIESRWGRDFPSVQTGPGAHPASCIMGPGSFPGVNSGRGVTLTPHTLLVPQSRKSRAITLLRLWAVRTVQSLSACTVELYLYSPYGPYSLYRASVPVQQSYNSTPPMGRTACTEPQCLYSTAIPQLPLRALRPVQSLCLYSTAIPLLPLWAVRPVQSLSACTVQLYLYSPYGPYGLCRAPVPVQYSYTSTPPVGRTACTEPQCLYKGVLYPFVRFERGMRIRRSVLFK